jgi:isocitrate/isopropylmalate dehydrogenase
MKLNVPFGNGIGPEVTDQTIKALKAIAQTARKIPKRHQLTFL